MRVMEHVNVLKKTGGNVSVASAISAQKPETGELMALRNLENLQRALRDVKITDFFIYVRGIYFANAPENPAFAKIAKEISAELKISHKKLWGNDEFQFLFSATTAEHLGMLGVSGEKLQTAKELLGKGRNINVLPYYWLVEDEWGMNKRLPNFPDLYSGESLHTSDPYKVFSGRAGVEAVDGKGNREHIGIRRFPGMALFHVTEKCPHGCWGCYKGMLVRNDAKALEGISGIFAKFKRDMEFSAEKAIRKTKLLVQWLNKHPEVHTVILSGGEPLLFDNAALGKIVEELKKAEHVRVVRICTSAVFQGRWYRIDDGFVEMIRKFKKETGKEVYINAHATDDRQILAPEARMAVKKLRENGIEVTLQIPVQEGVNFRRDDVEWSTKKLLAISRAAYETGVRPYKMIVDMHSQAYPEVTVPIETFMKVISALEFHLDTSDMQRWQAYDALNVINIYLYPFSAFQALKEIDEKQGRVVYFMGKPIYGNDGKPKFISVHVYEEPLLKGHNDEPGSVRINDERISARVGEIRKAYYGLKSRIREIEQSALSFDGKRFKVEKMEDEFYALCGIELARNDPLVVEQF